MPLLLHTVRQARWLKEPAAKWLRNGDVPADAVSDLKTTDNKLSVWEVAEDKSNLERIVRAIAVGKHQIASTGYIIFDSTLLTEVGIDSTHEKGTTEDAGANEWHRDLIQLSGNKLVALTRAVLERGESGVVLKKRLLELIAAGIDVKELPEKCRAMLPTAASGG